MTFDIAGARKAGYSDGEITDFLGSSNDAGFDVAGAAKAGYSPSEILSYLGEQKPKGVIGRVKSALSGSGGAVADSGAADPMTGIDPTGGQAIDTPKTTSGLDVSAMPEQFKSGVAGMQSGFYANNAKNSGALLASMNRIDRGEHLPMDQDVLGYQDMTPEQRAATRANFDKNITGNVANAVKYNAEQKTYVRNQTADQVIQLANDGNYASAWKAFKSDPAGVLQQLSVESTPNALPSIAGGAAGVLMRGGVAGLMAGLATGSFPVEYISSITDSLQNSGIDLNDTAAVEAKLRDPEFIAQAGKRAMTRGAVIAAADGVSGKLLMPLKAGAGALKNVARGAANVGMEVGAEMGGEAGAQAASGEKLRVGDILAEGLGAGPQAAAHTGLKTIAAIKDQPATRAAPSMAETVSAIQSATTIDEAIAAANDAVSAPVSPVASPIIEAQNDALLDSATTISSAKPAAIPMEPQVAQPYNSGSANAEMANQTISQIAQSRQAPMAAQQQEAAPPSTMSLAMDREIDRLSKKTPTTLTTAQLEFLAAHHPSEEIRNITGEFARTRRNFNPAQSVLPARQTTPQEAPNAVQSTDALRPAEPAVAPSAAAPVQPNSTPGRTPDAQPSQVGATDTAQSGPVAGRDIASGGTAGEQQPALTNKSEDIAGDKINKEWTAFDQASGTLGINRSEMPQIKAEHRGALVNFLNARGISHEQAEVSPNDLKATQREFSPAKVEKAKGFTGPDRSILVSSDGHVLDGHHQWIAKRESGEPVKVIRLNAPIKRLLAEVAEFPSVQAAGGAKPVQAMEKTPAVEPQATAGKVVERYLGRYGKGMSGPNARTEAKLRNMRQSTVEWRAEPKESLGYDRFEVVGYTKQAALQKKTERPPEQVAPEQELPAKESETQFFRPGTNPVDFAVKSGIIPTVTFRGTEPFKNKSDASIFRAKNKLDNTESIETDGGWSIAPKAGPLTDAQKQEARTDVAALNKALKAAGAPQVLPLLNVPSANHELARRLGKIFGTRVQFVTNNGAFDGVAHNGVAYLTKDLKRPELAIAGHEIFHTLEQSNPQMAEDLLDHVRGYLQDGVIEARQQWEAVQSGESISERYAAGEVMADLNGAMWLDPKFWREMLDRDTNLFRRVAYLFMEKMTKAVESLTGTRFDVHALVTDVDAVRKLIAQTWVDHIQQGDTKSADENGVAFSRTERIEADNALKALSEADPLFKLPKSREKEVEDIAHDNIPGVQVRKLTNIPGETRYNFTFPDGQTARMMVRHHNPYGNTIYGYDMVDGEMTAQVDERPGRNAEAVDGKDDVFIDVSLLKEGSGYGARMYNIAATYAHNNGKVFIGDPNGLSDEALRRRSEQMLSSALKFGTTKHLAPHPRQVKGDKDLGIPGLDWVYGDHIGNIEKLIDVNLANIENAGGIGGITYNIANGSFTDSDGNELTRDDLSGLAQSGLGRPAHAGGATLARAALLRALRDAGPADVSVDHGTDRARGITDERANAQADTGRRSGPRDASNSTGARGTGGNPVSQESNRSVPAAGQNGMGLLDRLVLVASQFPASVDKLFYSRKELNEATDQGGLSTSKPATSRLSKASYLGELDQSQEQAARAVGAITEQETIKERLAAQRSSFAKTFVQGLADQFSPLKELDSKAYLQARMSKASDGALEALMLYGKPYLRDGIPDVKIDSGFAKVLSNLDGEHDRFLLWVAAQRAALLKLQKKENLFTDSDISSLRTLNRNDTKHPNRESKFADALSKLNEFNDAVLQVAVESGILSDDARQLFKNQPYVPFYRAMEGEGPSGPSFSSGLVNQYAFKKLKGGSSQLNQDLLANVLLNWSHLYAASAKNRAATMSMAAAVRVGVAQEVPSGTKGSIKILESGQYKHYEVDDPHIFDAISALEHAVPKWFKPFSTVKRWLTIGVTANPAFKVRNLMRDSISAIAQGELSYNPAKNVVQGFKATKKDSQTYASMLASGGVIRLGSMIEGDRAHYAHRLIASGVKEATILDESNTKKLIRMLAHVIEAYNDIGDRFENVNRAALYEQMVQRGYTHDEASFAARDLLDFSMSGRWPVVRFLTQSVPFLNARIQGLYKLGRASKEEPKRVGYVVGAVVLASLALLLAQSDDEDWKKREDWDRDTYWWFKIGNVAYRIPKPFEIGAIGTLAERTWEKFTDKEMTWKRYRERMADTIFQQFNFNPTPQLFKPMMDIYANKDSFTNRPIESPGLQRLRTEDRATERTSSVARFLGSLGLPDPGQAMMGRYKDVSPVQVDFLLRGYFGWLGTAATTVVDYLARPFQDRGDKPTQRLRDWFFVGNFAETLPSGSSRYVTQMYEQSKEIEEVYNSFRNKQKAGDKDGAKSLLEAERAKLEKYRKTEAVVHGISEINAEIKRIEASRSISSDAKRERMEKLEQRRNNLAKKVN